MVGFGANDIAVLTGGLIDTTGITALALSMPRDGTITSVAAYLSVGAAVSLIGSEVTVTAQLYQSTAPDNSFAPIAGTEVALAPVLTGALSIGDTANGLVTGLSIPITAESRLMLVFSAAVTDGIDIATIISAFLSGGVNIE